MSTTGTAPSLVVDRDRWQPLVWAGDVCQLTKPKIGVLILATVAVSGFVARWGQPDPWLLAAAMLGTFLVAGSASALNQWIERRRDALMPRTADRPLPAGRLSDRQVMAFAAVLLAAGFFCLLLAVNWPTALVGLTTWFIYVCVYTPLKSRTAINTAVGAVAGAMPVLIGWTAVGAAPDTRAAALFLIVFLWQFPHFMAIAWIYREQYARGGMKMLSVVDPSGRRSGVQAVLAAVALLPVSFVPALGVGGSWYIACAFVLGTLQLACAVLFFTRLSDASARLLLRASLVYLPALLALLALVPLL